MINQDQIEFMQTDWVTTDPNDNRRYMEGGYTISAEAAFTENDEASAAEAMAKITADINKQIERLADGEPSEEYVNKALRELDDIMAQGDPRELPGFEEFERVWTIEVPHLTVEEHKVLDSLVKGWNEFLKLESLHNDDTADFRQAIHQAQRIILARPMMRQIQKSDDKAID